MSRQSPEALAFTVNIRLGIFMAFVPGKPLNNLGSLSLQPANLLSSTLEGGTFMPAYGGEITLYTIDQS